MITPIRFGKADKRLIMIQQKTTLTLLTLPAAIIAALVSTSVHANDATIDLSTVMITATRDADTGNKSLRDVDILNKETLDEQQATTVPQTIAYLPNVTTIGGPRDDVQTVNIRGLEGQQVLQLIDGARQNFVSGHRPTYMLDPSLLKSIEVIKGPSSSLWGSGALGGVISANTIHAADVLKPGKTTGGFIKQGYQSNNNQWLTTGAFANRSENVDVLISGYYNDSDDTELGNDETLANSATRDKGIMAKVDWLIDDAQTATFNLRSSNSTGGVPSNGTANVNRSNFLIDRENKTHHASIDYRFNPNSDLVNMQGLVYWNKTDMDESRVSDGRADTTKIKTLGLNINNQSRLGSIAIIYGVDGYQDRLDNQRGGSERPAPASAITDVWGAFTNVEIPFAEQWQLDIGARYDYFATESKNLNQDRSDNALSPSIALAWQATPQLNMTLRYDEAFRAPTSEELYASGTHFCMGPGFCNTFLPNPSLKAEQAENIELMADYKLTSVIRDNDALQLSANIFHNKVDNFIEQKVDNPVFAPVPNPGNTYYSNVDEAILEGFELSMDYQVADFEANLSYGQTRGENDKTGEKLAQIPADKWVLDLSKKLADNAVKVGMKVTYAESQDQTPNDDTRIYEHYTLADLYLRWQPRDVDNMTIDLSLNNLTDQYYRVAFQQLHMPGRDIRLALKYDF